MGDRLLLIALTLQNMDNVMNITRPLVFTMPKFENTWNWSNTLTLLTLAIGGVIAFTSVRSDTMHLQEDMAAMKAQVEQVQQFADKAQIQSESRIIARLDQLQQDVREIRAAQLRKGNQ
jgi:hypothetical protein